RRKLRYSEDVCGSLTRIRPNFSREQSQFGADLRRFRRWLQRFCSKQTQRLSWLVTAKRGLRREADMERTRQGRFERDRSCRVVIAAFGLLLTIGYLAVTVSACRTGEANRIDETNGAPA